ncbi:LptM family lipoprotein [Rummeliibacillus pycnus]|uniref:LptM family lipoprotein n=1 Tax=Rummeliibacillus pycnus TaxID=101070 RepID=UPI003D2CEB75
MKRIVGLLFLCIMALTLFACGQDQASDKEVLELLKDYKTVQYNIKDPLNPPSGTEIGEKVKGYFREDEYEKQMANRVFQIAPEIAKASNKSIQLENVKLKKSKENKDGTIDYDYTIKLKLYDDQSSEEIEKNGQLTVDGLKITRDWEDRSS